MHFIIALSLSGLLIIGSCFLLIKSKELKQPNALFKIISWLGIGTGAFLVLATFTMAIFAHMHHGYKKPYHHSKKERQCRKYKKEKCSAHSGKTMQKYIYQSDSSEVNSNVNIEKTVTQQGDSTVVIIKKTINQ